LTAWCGTCDSTWATSATLRPRRGPTSCAFRGQRTETMEHYRDLACYSDWVAEAQRQRRLYPAAPPGPETQARVREVLGFSSGPEAPLGLQVGRTWEHDGVVGEELSWSVGYGPGAAAWVLKPADASGPLPGIVALHDHGGFKYFGKEKIARGPEPTPEYLVRGYHDVYYGGRAWANALAREGFVVLVHDTFLWGSRRFPLEVMPEWAGRAFRGLEAEGALEGWAPAEVEAYNFSASEHEHVVEKYCDLLGTTMAGVVAHEDRIAVNVLRSRADVDAARVGCIGLSGGGNRSALLQATHPAIRGCRDRGADEHVSGVAGPQRGLAHVDAVPQRLVALRRLARPSRLPCAIAAAGAVRSGRRAVHGRGDACRARAAKRHLQRGGVPGRLPR